MSITLKCTCGCPGENEDAKEAIRGFMGFFVTSCFPQLRCVRCGGTIVVELIKTPEAKEVKSAVQ